MPMLYISLCSGSSGFVVQRVVAECESFLAGECVMGSDHDTLAPETIRKSLERCDVLIIAIGEEEKSSNLSDVSGNGAFWNERIRFEIVSAMNLDLLIIPLLIDNAKLPEKRSLPGALKRLLDYKPYRLREAFWREDLPPILEEIQRELDFKRDIKEKISKLNQSNFLSLTDSEGKPLRLHGLGLEFSGALESRRVIESERVNLENARRRGDLIGEKKALTVMGLTFTQLRQTQKAIQLFEEQLKITRELGDVEEELGILANLGDAFAISGEIDHAKRYYQEQLLRADSSGYRHFVASALNGLGFVSVKQNQIFRAIECYSKALKIYRELENHEKELELLVGIGLNYQKLGQLEQMTNALKQALEAAKFLEDRKEEAQILVDLGEAYFHRGNLEPSNACLDRAEEILNFREESWVGPLKHRLIFLRDNLGRT